MGNRFTRTAFTARQRKTLRSIIADLDKIKRDRKGKQDNPDAEKRLNQAILAVFAALEESKYWVSYGASKEWND